MNVGASLVALAAAILLWGLLFAFVAVATVRRTRTQWLWVGWGAVTLAIVTAWTVTFHRAFPDAGRIAETTYMTVVFIGLPTAAAAFAASRLRARTPSASWFRHIAMSFSAYLLAVPIAFVLGVLPDIARMF